MRQAGKQLKTLMTFKKYHPRTARSSFRTKESNEGSKSLRSLVIRALSDRRHLHHHRQELLLCVPVKPPHAFSHQVCPAHHLAVRETASVSCLCAAWRAPRLCWSGPYASQRNESHRSSSSTRQGSMPTARGGKVWASGEECERYGRCGREGISLAASLEFPGTRTRCSSMTRDSTLARLSLLLRRHVILFGSWGDDAMPSQLSLIATKAVHWKESIAAQDAQAAWAIHSLPCRLLSYECLDLLHLPAKIQFVCGRRWFFQIAA